MTEVVENKDCLRTSDQRNEFRKEVKEAEEGLGGDGGDWERTTSTGSTADTVWRDLALRRCMARSISVKATNTLQVPLRKRRELHQIRLYLCVLRKPRQVPLLPHCETRVSRLTRRCSPGWVSAASSWEQELVLTLTKGLRPSQRNRNRVFTHGACLKQHGYQFRFRQMVSLRLGSCGDEV
jgi:hypothetical protein